jgi:exopolysaccharide biosynthesis polyprenyl glycosylphosphotransferase
MHVDEQPVGVQAAIDVARADVQPLLPEPAWIEPPRAGAHAEVDRAVLRLVVAAGRGGAVLMAVLVTYSAIQPLGVEGVAAVAALTSVWLATLRRARTAGHTMLAPSATLAVGSATGLVAIAALDPWFPGMQLGLLPLAGMAVGVLVSAAAWEAAVRRTSLGRRRILVVGSDHVSDSIAEELHAAGMRHIELFEHARGSNVDERDVLERLRAVVDEQVPDLVVLTDERSYGDALDRLLDGPAPRFRVVGLAGFFEHVLGRVPVDQLRPEWFMGIVHVRQPAHARWAKRACDLLAAGAALVVLSPVMLAVALAVRATGRPILHRQTRVGERGKLFTIYKFRTMVPDAEADGVRLACEGDPRTTSCGRFLRRAHLDELPQLWNVVKGEMAIVGPRPERPEFVDELERTVPYWTRRVLVTPGVTGWAQLRCGYATEPCELAEKLSYDLWYVRHRSLLVDVAICLETIRLELTSLLPARARAHCGVAERGIGR